MLTQRDVGWIAGFLEGEGSFTFNTTPLVSANQVQREPLGRLQALLGGNLGSSARAARNPKHSDFWRWTANGSRAAGIMMTLYQIMSPRRRGQIATSLKSWRSTRPSQKYWNKCTRGHEFTATNTLWQKPDRPGNSKKRRCRECILAHNRRYYASQPKRVLTEDQRRRYTESERVRRLKRRTAIAMLSA